MHIRRLRARARAVRQDRTDRDGARQRLPARRAAMSAASARTGLVARRRWSRCGHARDVWAIVGAALGARRCSRSARRRSSRSTCVTCSCVDATGPPVRSTPRCPRAAASWARRVLRDLPARAHARSRSSATCAHASSASAARPRRCPTAWSCSMRRNRIEWANPRALRAARPRPRDGSRPAARQPRAPARVPRATSRPATSPSRCVVESQRAAGATLSLQLVPFGIDEKLLLSPRRHAARGGRAHAPRLHRQRLARAQDAAHGHRRLPRDDAGPRPRRAAAHALPRADAGAGAQHAAPRRRPAHAVGARERAEPGARRARSRSCRCCSSCRRTRRRCRAASTRSRSTSATPRSVIGQPRRARERVRQPRVATRSATRRTGGTITLALARRRRRARACSRCTDTGIGIAPEHIPRLTERFYRVDRSRSRATGGTGLGLAIVKHVLLRHQAELDVESEPGAGSTFAVRLPAAPRARPSRCGRAPAWATRLALPVAQRRAEQRS